MGQNNIHLLPPYIISVMLLITINVENAKYKQHLFLHQLLQRTAIHPWIQEIQMYFHQSKIVQTNHRPYHLDWHTSCALICYIIYISISNRKHIGYFPPKFLFACSTNFTLKKKHICCTDRDTILFFKLTLQNVTVKPWCVSFLCSLFQHQHLLPYMKKIWTGCPSMGDGVLKNNKK